MSELAIPLIDCWKFMRFFLSIAEKLSILLGIHLYIIIHKGSFTFRCQCFSLTMSELSPKLKHTRINYLRLDLDMIARGNNNNMISTGLTSRQIGATTASHQSAPTHHMPPGTYWLSVGAWLTTAAVITAVGLSLFIEWWWWVMVVW